MPDYQAIVQNLRRCFPNTDDHKDAATAIETLLAQRAVLVKEVEAWRDHKYLNPVSIIDAPIRRARAATDAAFKGGLTK